MKRYLQLMRFDKPIGMYLLLWPTWIALGMASQGMPDFKMICIFTMGVIVMRAAGCVINDICDRKFDGGVARTQNRVLVTGQVSLSTAWKIFVGLVGMAMFLAGCLNTQTQRLALIGLGLAMIYPLMKRYFVCPQLMLGLAFGWTVPMVFMAIQGAWTPITSLLYACVIVWVLIYDTQYALMDRSEDIKLGLHSSAIFFGRHHVMIIACLQWGFLLLWGYLGYRLHAVGAFAGSGLGVACLFGYQQKCMRARCVKHYYRAFSNHHYVGIVLWLGTIQAFT